MAASIQNINFNGNTYKTVFCSPEVLSGADTDTANILFILFYFTGADGNLVHYDNGYNVSILAGQLNVNGLNTMIPNVNHMYLLALFSGGPGFLIDMANFDESSAIVVNCTEVPAQSTTLTVLGGVGNTNGIVEIVPYFNLQSVEQVYNYFHYTYLGGFPLPLTFPANSIPQLN